MAPISNANRISKSKAYDIYKGQCIALAKPFHDALHSDVTRSECFWCLYRDGKISSPSQVTFVLRLNQYNPEAENGPPSSTDSTQAEPPAAPFNGANTRAVDTSLAEKQVVEGGAGVYGSRNTYTIETSRGGSRVEITAPQGEAPRMWFMGDGKNCITFKSVD